MKVVGNQIKSTYESDGMDILKYNKLFYTIPKSVLEEYEEDYGVGPIIGYGDEAGKLYPYMNMDEGSYLRDYDCDLIVEYQLQPTEIDLKSLTREQILQSENAYCILGERGSLSYDHTKKHYHHELYVIVDVGFDGRVILARSYSVGYDDDRNFVEDSMEGHDVFIVQESRRNVYGHDYGLTHFELEDAMSSVSSCTLKLPGTSTLLIGSDFYQSKAVLDSDGHIIKDENGNIVRKTSIEVYFSSKFCVVDTTMWDIMDRFEDKQHSFKFQNGSYKTDGAQYYGILMYDIENGEGGDYDPSRLITDMMIIDDKYYNLNSCEFISCPDSYESLSVPDKWNPHLVSSWTDDKGIRHIYPGYSDFDDYEGKWYDIRIDIYANGRISSEYEYEETEDEEENDE